MKNDQVKSAIIIGIAIVIASFLISSAIGELDIAIHGNIHVY